MNTEFWSLGTEFSSLETVKYAAVSTLFKFSCVQDQHVLLTCSGLTPSPDNRSGKTFLAIVLAEIVGFSLSMICDNLDSGL